MRNRMQHPKAKKKKDWDLQHSVTIQNTTISIYLLSLQQKWVSEDISEGKTWPESKANNLTANYKSNV
jgi:hypothetical protein